MNDFGAMVAAASLAHDRESSFWTFRWESDRYFSIGKGKQYKDNCQKEWQDLIDFEMPMDFQFLPAVQVSKADFRSLMRLLVLLWNTQRKFA
jgi:hypothetical protein